MNDVGRATPRRRAHDADVVVVGAGLMGAAAAWSLARRGRRVLLVEQYAPRHRRGSSHGSARIVRRAYGDALYTRLTGRAFELWRELEATTSTPLLRMIGGLDFGPARDVPTIAAHLAAAGVEHDLLPADEAEKRWPGMRFEGAVLFHPQAGTLDAAAAVDALTARATAAGAAVRYDTAVVDIAVTGDEVDVRLADDTTVRAGHVVVAAGAWLPPLLSPLVALPAMTVTQQSVFHFPRHDPAATPWPSVIHAGARNVYHLAGGRDGGAGDDRKLGEHDGGPVTTAADRDDRIDTGARRRAVEYVRRWLPGLDPTPRGEATCLYTRTASEDFVLDRVGPVVVCSPCSGHGAKFAPLIGEWVADLVVRGVGEADAELPVRFRLSGHGRAPTVPASL